MRPFPLAALLLSVILFPLATGCSNPSSPAAPMNAGPAPAPTPFPLNHPWAGNIPASGSLPLAPYLLALDSSRNLYVATGSPTVYVYDFLGNLQATWTLPTPSGGGGPWSLGIAVDPAQTYVYVLDGDNGLLDQLNLSNGSLRVAIGGQAGAFNHPQGLGVDRNGNVFVCDTDNKRVQEFAASGAPVTTWPMPNMGVPYGAAADSSGYIYVVDASNNDVVKFLPPAPPSSGVSWNGSQGAGAFNSPLQIAVDSCNDVYVADYSNTRIQEFDGNGRFLTSWGGLGTTNGQFGNGTSHFGPWGLAVDGLGDVYAADTSNGRVEIFGP